MQTTLDDAFAALADPTRRSLLTSLAQGSCRAGDLARPHDISRPAVSRHLRVMREAGLIASETRGREQWYRLVPSALDPALSWMNHAAALWPSALAALKHHIEGDA